MPAPFRVAGYERTAARMRLRQEIWGLVWDGGQTRATISAFYHKDKGALAVLARLLEEHRIGEDEDGLLFPIDGTKNHVG